MNPGEMNANPQNYHYYGYYHSDDDDDRYLDKPGEELMDAVNEGDLELVKSLIAQGANPETCFENPLVIAASKGYIDIVKILFESSVFMEETVTNNDEAIILADKGHHWKVVRYLISKGGYSDSIDLFRSYDPKNEKDLIEMIDIETQHGNKTLTKNKIRYEGYLVRKNKYLDTINTTLQKRYPRDISKDLMRYLF